MHRDDQIDPARAKHFAWSFALPGDSARVRDLLRTVEAREEGTARAMPRAPGVSPTDEVRRSREKSRAACGALAAGVAEAWALTDEEAGARALKRLLARADRIGMAIVGMEAHPEEAVRLVRLFVKHGARMTRRQRERASAIASAIPLKHGEVANLLVEIARAGDRNMADALLSDGDFAPTSGDVQDVAARLADVVEEGPTDDARTIGVDFIGRLDRCSIATGALLRALREPCFSVRSHALHALATATPCALRGEDLAFILRDLVARPPGDAFADEESEEDERLMAQAIIAALSHAQPAEAEEALLDWIDAEHDSVWLDPGWATEALAMAFPETAAAMVDHWLKCARSYERLRALGALERLPEGLAEPRLRLATSDPALAVRDGARRIWLRRFERPYPTAPADLLGGVLLDGPPSDGFAARLAVMHGRVRDARIAMARVLLAESPGREALVLLLQLVGDDGDSGEPSFAPRDEGWAAAVVERFGKIGVEGLCLLAARFREPESFGWMRRLGDLVERGTIARDDAAPVRKLATDHILSEESGRVDDALRVLALVGAPSELLDRVLALALNDEIGAAEARGLVISWPDRSADARLASEMALALAERSWTRLRYASTMALTRGAPAALVIAQRVLEVAEHDSELIDCAVECARRLREVGVIDESWAFSALARPESPAFTVAAKAWRDSSSVRAALEAALGSKARGGASAVQAAISLLSGSPALSPRDRRLPVILESAAMVPRAELVHAMCMHGAPFGVVVAHLRELLVSSDPSVTSALVGIALWLRSPKARALLRTIRPMVVDQELRADIEDTLGAHDAARAMR